MHQDDAVIAGADAVRFEGLTAMIKNQHQAFK
jgi:hypothetical protein